MRPGVVGASSKSMGTRAIMGPISPTCSLRFASAKPTSERHSRSSKADRANGSQAQLERSVWDPTSKKAKSRSKTMQAEVAARCLVALRGQGPPRL